MTLSAFSPRRATLRGLLGLAVAAASLVGSPASAARTDAVDVAHSQARFSVAHVLVSRVDGTVPITSGTVDYGADATLPTHVEATLDPRRIASGDAKRDADLQGPDWFDTAKYPTWRFVGDRAETAPGGYVVHGELTVHGTAQACDLRVSALPSANGERRVHAETTVDRHGFGMTRTRADAMVGGRIAIVLDAALRPATATPAPGVR